MNSLEKYFEQFRQNIIGINSQIPTPNGLKTLIYADWIASGRMYKPIEETISEKILPYVANTHSEASYVGMYMTNAYHLANKVIKNHVNANEDDVLITADAGMTRLDGNSISAKRKTNGVVWIKIIFITNKFLFIFIVLLSY